VLNELKTFFEEIKGLRIKIKAVNAVNVNPTPLRNEAEQIGSHWCSDIGPRLKATAGFESGVAEKYTLHFERLIKLSASTNPKSSYLSALDSITKRFQKDFILPVQQNKVALSSTPKLFDQFLATISASDEGDYFKEAISCAKAGFLRAATVLAWCTAIDRIHRKIVEIGVPSFNVTAAYIASQKSGRFKKFTKTFNINSLSELREVFDNDVLWVIEGMALIDSNQHTRLKSCFDMRNQSAHPGEAPITEYNLVSTFSDIDQIVLKNAKFQLKNLSVPAEAGESQPSCS
jgi:hypothetical protein